jgi:FkbM family methyltransferase
MMIRAVTLKKLLSRYANGISSRQTHDELSNPSTADELGNLSTAIAMALGGKIEEAITSIEDDMASPRTRASSAGLLAEALFKETYPSLAADIALKYLPEMPEPSFLAATVTYLASARRFSEIGSLAINDVIIGKFDPDSSPPIELVIETLETLGIDPQSDTALWAIMGNLHARVGNLDRAATALRQAIGGNMMPQTNLLTLGQILAADEKFEEALRAFHGALAVAPNNTAALEGVNSINQAISDREIKANRELDQRIEKYGETDPNLLSHLYRRGMRRIITDALLPLLPGARVVVIDGGAREAHRDVRWRPLTPDHLEIHGFEPDPPECERLNAEMAELGIAGGYHPVGLWSETTELPFEINAASGGHSFIPQNDALTDRWKFENPTEISLSRDVFRPLETVPMQVTRLDSWAAMKEIAQIDFCKLNVQGAEIEIMDGAGPLLDKTLGLLLEVAFVESYVERPMFSDVDAYVRDKGFIFFDLLAHHYVGRAAADIATQHMTLLEPLIGAATSSWGQLIEGHALYLRDPIEAARCGRDLGLSQTDLLKLVIVAETFGQIEYAFELLAWITDAADPDFSEKLRAAHRTALETYHDIFDPK